MSNNEWDDDRTARRAPDHTPPSDATIVVPRGTPPAAQPPTQQPRPANPGYSSPPPPQPASPPPTQAPPAPGYPPAPASGQPPSYAQPPSYGQAPGYAPAPAYGGPQYGATPAKYRSPGGAITMIVGALLAILGTFLPWLSFGEGSFSQSVNGYETYFLGDRRDAVEWANPGAYVLGAMLVVIVMAVVILSAGRSTATWILGIVVAGLAGLITLGAFGAVGDVLGRDIFDSLTIGVGIVLCVLGAIAVGVGSLIVAAKKS